MKAIQIQSHGDLEVLRVKALPDPDPGVDELLVRIKASAVNPLDGIIRTGEFPIAKEPPLILGEEAASLNGMEAGSEQEIESLCMAEAGGCFAMGPGQS